MIKLHKNMIASVNEPLQLAAAEALYHGMPDVEMMVKEYDKYRRYMVEGFIRICYAFRYENIVEAVRRMRKAFRSKK